jgi:glutathione S-transferase
MREHQMQQLGKRIGYVEQTLVGPYLTGTHFTAADAYLFTVLSWSGYVKLDLAPFPKVVAFNAQVSARPAVQAALRAEGLLK